MDGGKTWLKGLLSAVQKCFNLKGFSSEITSGKRLLRIREAFKSSMLETTE
jgi:hypothetical protein